MIAALKLVNTPPLALYQDLGRFGQSHLGLTQGGAIDPNAMKIANWLVNNAATACSLELTFGQFEARVLAPISIAVTGASVQLYVNSKPVSTWQSHYLKRGDTLKIDTPTNGIRNYLAIGSGLVSQRYFTSQATVIRELLGTRLTSGDVVFCEVSTYVAPKKLPPSKRPSYHANAIRVVMGYQFNEFSEHAKNTFTSTRYTISPQSDRMGYRLTGEGVQSVAANRYSEGISLGAIQIPPDGQPIVLLNDRQTIGGYPKIGRVLSLDAALLGQQAPGKTVKFEFIDVAKAQHLVREANAKLALIAQMLAS
jgi:biotin-dependent carboxylase-like uncharacterized protein